MAYSRYRRGRRRRGLRKASGRRARTGRIRRRRINAMKTKRSRVFTKCAVRCASKLLTYQYQVLGQGTANDTLANVNLNQPIFINLTELIAYATIQSNSGAGTAYVENDTNILKAFIESCRVTMFINNNVGSTSKFNGNRLRFRIMEFYYNNYVSYLAADNATNTRPQWSAVDPTTGGTYNPVLTKLWIDNQFNATADQGDFNYLTLAKVNYSCIPYHKSRFFDLFPIPNTGTNPGGNFKVVSFRYRPQRPMSFKTIVKDYPC